ncbi:O-antigen ligase family protein [Patescibacteria group bacterium]|nr:O-antigen ligase family protein [Patescibacteria group bacterium]MBU1074510.1 O-antigen ligase family protein [Patescibacteria group bacterium]MBU1951693.1 O-antigen ligase family protein [Patescibacteria group bacterium]
MEISFLIIFSFFFFLLAWKKIEIALMLTVLLLPSYLIRFEVFSIPATLLEIMILLLFIVWGIKKVFIDKLKDIKCTQFKWPLLLLFVSATIAVFISPDLQSALGIYKAYFVEAILFFIVFTNVINSPRRIRLIFWALGVSALFVSVIALWQYIEILPSYEPWVSESPKRVTSIFEYPNAVGLYLTPIATLFLGILLLAKKHDKKADNKLAKGARQFITGVVIFALLAIAFSVSRGAVLGIGAAILFFSFFSRFKKWIWIAIVVSVLTVLIIPQTRTTVWDIVTVKDTSTDVRTVLWQGTWNLIKDRPLQGAGLAGFPTVYEEYKLAKHTEFLLYPHNIVMNFWVELGILGLIALLWLLVMFFKEGHSIRKRTIDLYPIPKFRFSIVLMGVLIATLAYGMVDVPYFKNDLAVLFWIIVGFMVSQKNISNQSRGGQKSNFTL